MNQHQLAAPPQAVMANCRWGSHGIHHVGIRQCLVAHVSPSIPLSANKICLPGNQLVSLLPKENQVGSWEVEGGEKRFSLLDSTLCLISNTGYDTSLSRLVFTGFDP